MWNGGLGLLSDDKPYPCRGHLWQERFHSFPMDENYLLSAVRYVELNPVYAHMVSRSEDFTAIKTGQETQQ